MPYRAALLAGLFALGAAAPAQAVPETAEGFSRAMQGCWNRTSWSAEVEASRRNPAFAISSQMCLEGGVSGRLTVLDCSGGNYLLECSEAEGRYAFRDEKFWRQYGKEGLMAGGLDNCDVRFGPGETFELHNCQWATTPEYGRATEDAVYEKATGQ